MVFVCVGCVVVFACFGGFPRLLFVCLVVLLICFRLLCFGGFVLDVWCLCLLGLGLRLCDWCCII